MKNVNKIINVNGGLQGFITITAKSPDGTERKIGPFKNLITDLAIDTMFNTPTNYSAVSIYCAVGTGNTTPAASDTALTTQNGTRSATAVQVSLVNGGSPNYVTKLIRSYLFAIGAVSGNLTEVGFFQGSSGSNCGSRSLIKDSGGSPTAFPVLVTEQLTVTYEVQYIPTITDVDSSISIASVSYNTKIRPHSIGSSSTIVSDAAPIIGLNPRAYDGVIGATTSTPAGNISGASSTTLATYTNGNFYRDFTYIWNPGSTSSLTGGVRCITYNSGLASVSGFQLQFTPIIPKTTLQTLTLIIRYGLTRP